MTSFSRTGIFCCLLMVLLIGTARGESPVKSVVTPVDYRIAIDKVLRNDDGKFLWYHPRVALLPGYAPNGGLAVLMTLLRELNNGADFYSGTYVSLSNDLGATWTPPNEPAELAWRHAPSGVNISVIDVTPGWHAPTKKVLAVGAQVRYNERGNQLDDIPRAHQTAYAVYDPQTAKWSQWQQLEMPPDEKFNYARSACSQWVIQDDGTVILPFFFAKARESADMPCAVTTVQCAFDGKTLKYIRHGDEIKDPDEHAHTRGICEPSLARYKGKYYLTIRHDLRGYVTSSDDGLHFGPLKPWQFDDGSDLGSYNTQQHWLVHSDGLFLVYTRRGANNDHIQRNRAPLFMAQVDPVAMHVIRSTERVLIPEHGGEMGNFGAEAIDEHQSWVTVSEGVYDDDARRHGAEGATYIARILWKSPNRLMSHGEGLAKAAP